MKMLNDYPINCSITASVYYSIYNLVNDSVRASVDASVWSLVYDSVCALVLESIKVQL